MNRSAFLLGILVWGLISCSKSNQGSPSILVTDNIDTSKSAVKYRGAFASAPGERVNGMALILFRDGTYTVALENLDAGNGPDLHLYLSKQLQPATFIDLGKLKSTKGNQVYGLNTVPDFAQYKYALIFCQQYNVLFGSAELK